MNPYFDHIPVSINCKPEDEARIREILAVIPEALLTDDVIAAIENGDPIELYTQPTTAAYRRAQDPLIQACFIGNILQYLTTPDYADSLDSAENHRRWNERYRYRCNIGGKICSPHKSCETCPNKDKKEPMEVPLVDYNKEQLSKEGVQRTPRGGYRPFNYSDPTADEAIENARQEALLEYLIKAGGNYAKEHVLRKHGYRKNKEIAALLGVSESTVSRDLKALDTLEAAFDADWYS